MLQKLWEGDFSRTLCHMKAITDLEYWAGKGQEDKEHLSWENLH